MRVLVAFPATLTASFVIDETPVDAGAVAVTVTDPTGSVVSTGPATQVSTGEYSYALPAQPTLGPLTATWVGSASVMTYPEVVGGQLINLADLRASDKQFADSGRWPTALLAAARDEVTAEFARITGRSFILRGGRFTADLDQSGSVLLADTDIVSIDSATINGTAVDVTTLTPHRTGLLEGLPLPVNPWLSQFWDGTISSYLPGPAVLAVRYTYGFPVVPEDVYRAAILRARWVLASSSSGIPDRATSFTAETGGTFNLATPGIGPWQTGIPDVDAVLTRYTIRSKGVSAA